ncbi:protein CYCLOPS-like [Juglans microcarpa x Juglans regia]|uniref:protein CYCLOPS-like n=1 Tax=Juglans microcarpa x Juglans regia TaxID=2249226 RepID=UPI001B7DA59F|nr:protein CYCLOPS-like [Juglans microcarpa x Juglans regia]
MVIVVKSLKIFKYQTWEYFVTYLLFDRLGRISIELASLSSQQHEEILRKKRSNDNLHQQSNSALIISLETTINYQNSVEKGLQTADLYLAKAWFRSSQPMTRSQSSELRRRYAAMLVSQTTVGMEVMQNASGHGVNILNQEFAHSTCFNDPSMCGFPNQVATFMSLSNSSSSTFSSPQMADMDKVSSVVSMLSCAVDQEDSTKKRRVDRSRKMAEAKERNLTPAIPSDMQSVLRQCENLEKEVRSLKLNLSFMNRKDTEQNKQIEEPQQMNEELVDEKERPLEEIERIVSESDKMC